MFRFILFAKLVLIVGVLCGQSNLYPDTLERNNQIDYVIVYQDCNFCIPVKEDKPIRKYYFDEQGLNYKTEGLDSLMGPSSRILIEYENGQLHSYENYSSYIGTYPDYEMYWDSTSRLQKVIYDYDDDKLKSITWLEEDDRIHFDIVFEYNKLGKVIKETQKWYAYSDAISFQAFESNTADFMDSIKVLENMTREKTYKYSDQSCKITYLVNSKQTGVEEITYVKNDLMSTRLLKDIQGDTLLLETFMYDDLDRVKEKKLMDTGYDGFGDSYDLFGSEKTQYLYDEKGRVKMVKQYYGNENFLLDKYVYIKK